MKPPIGKIIAWLILLIVALSAAGVMVGYQEATKGRDALIEAARAIQERDFGKAEKSLLSAGTHMGRARIAFGSMSWLRTVPGVGKTVGAAYDVTFAARETAVALADAVGLARTLEQELAEVRRLRPSGRLTLATLSPEERGRIGSALVRASVKVRSGEARIALARARLARIPTESGIQGLDDARSVLITTLAQLEDRLRPLSIATLIVPKLAGFPEPTNTLFLLLNNHELRPGGGFIGTYALMKTYAGAVQDLETQDSYAIDRAAEHTGIAPPEPIAKYLGLKELFFRDSNWSPDFPTSAAESLRLFRLEHQKAYGSDPAISFVVGLTPNVTAELLRLVGPITVETSTFTPENVADELEYQVEKGFTAKGIPRAQRKEILAKLADIMMTRLSALPFDEWPKIAQILETQVHAKQLMMYSPEPDLQVLLDQLGVTARIPQTDGDFLMVVDANLGALKTDPVVKRHIAYQREEDELGNHLSNSVTTVYRHEGTPSWKILRYQSFTRVYIPRGSRILSVQDGGQFDNKGIEFVDQIGWKDSVEFQTGEEAGMQWVGTLVKVSPGKTRLIRFNFEPRQNLFSGKSDYHLTVPRAPGSGVADLTLGLQFDKNIVSALPSEEIGAFNDNRYDFEGKLREDQEFVIRFR